MKIAQKVKVFPKNSNKKLQKTKKLLPLIQKHYKKPKNYHENSHTP